MDVTGGYRVSREDCSDNASFPAAEYTTIESFFRILKDSTRFYEPLNSCSFRVEQMVELYFEETHGVSFYDRSILDILGFGRFADKNWPGACFVGNNEKMDQAKQPIRAEYPIDIASETNMFFVITNIIEQQLVADVKSSLFHVTDTEKQFSNWKLQAASTTAHIIFTELEFEKFVTSTVEIQIELVSKTGKSTIFSEKASCIDTKFPKTLKIEEYYLRQAVLSHFFGVFETTWKWIWINDSRSWPSRTAICKKNPAVKSVGKELFNQSIPEIVEVC